MKSVLYLEQYTSLLGQSVSEWRQRARYAVRCEKPVLARQLLLQAQLIKLWRESDSHWNEDLANCEDSAFRWFVRHTYQRYLRYVDEADRGGLLTRGRKYMLQPWAKFVFQAWEEDIMRTLSEPSSIDVPETRPRPVSDPRDSLPNRPSPVFRDGGSLADQRHTTQGQYGPRHSGYTLTTLPSRPRRPDAFESPISEARVPPRGTEQPRRERPYLDQPEAQQAQQSVTESDLDSGYPSRAALTQRRDVVDPTRNQRQGVSRLGRFEVDDLDDVQAEDHYQLVNGPTDPLTRPRLLSPRSSPADTFQAQGRMPEATEVDRSDNPQRSSSTTVPARRQPADLSDLLKAFVAIKKANLKGCCQFCTSNPAIWKQDSSVLEAVASERLRQNRDDEAERIVQRRVMLRDGNKAREGGPEWMRKLAVTPGRQEALEDACKVLLSKLKKNPAATLLSPPSVSAVRARKNEPKDRHAAQGPEPPQGRKPAATAKTSRS